MENFNISFPIDFIKKEQRVVVGIATADNVDKAGDIVDFDASLEAFKAWSGNIREMHSPIAVGKAIKYEPIQIKDPDGNIFNAIRVEAYISKGAQDTWEKVLDGTLRSFSIGGKILEKYDDAKKMFNGRPVSIIKKYVLGELSLVDNPANSIAVIDIVKRDGYGNLNYILQDVVSKGGLDTWFKEDWVDLSRPKKGGGFETCGREHASDGKYPKCVPAKRAASMTAEEIRSAIQRKRRAESSQQREGKKPIMVSTIAKEDRNVPVNMELYNRVKQEAKQKFDVYPSAYANGWLVQEYKRRGGKYKTVSKADSQEDSSIDNIDKVSQYKDPKGGLTAAGRAHFKQTEGSNLKPGVKGAADTPEKMRRKGSFLTRFFTNPSGPMKDDKGRPTRLALSAAAWGEPVPQDRSDAAELAAKGRRLLERYDKAKNAKKFDDIQNILKADNIVVSTDTINTYPTQGIPKSPKPKRRNLNNKKEKVMEKDDHYNMDLCYYLKNSFCNATVLYFSAHRAHWNVEGPDFFQYHSLFETIYSDIYESIDPFAENIRKLNDFPPTLSECEYAAAFEDNSSSSDAKNLALDLYLKNYTFLSILKETFDCANSMNEQGIANFIAERIDAHDKWDWQLRSSLLASGVDIPMDAYDDSSEGMDDNGNMNESDMPDPEQGMETNNPIGEMSAPIGNLDQIPDVTDATANDGTTEMEMPEMSDTAEMSPEEILALIAQLLGKSVDSSIENGYDVLKHDTIKDMDLIKMQVDSLQDNINYDSIFNMVGQDQEKLSLVKRFMNWLIPNEQEVASTSEMVEVTKNIQEEDMDIEVLKNALSAVVDQKLEDFATSIKNDVEASLQSKIENITKSFEAQTAELEDKLEASESALAAQEIEFKSLAKSGASKKSIDPEDDDDDELIKSAEPSFWDNVFMPQSTLDALSFRS